MLILTRRVGEAICVGEEIKISVFSTKHGQTKFGIEAPTTVQVHREEVYRRIKDGEKKN